jgi:hypothetical protein
MRQPRKNRVTTAPPPSALRQLRRHLARPPVLVALGAVAAIAAISGPFGTAPSMSWPERTVYWGLVVPATYATGFLTAVRVEARLRALPVALRLGAEALAIALAVTAVLLGINAGFGQWPATWAEAALGFAGVALIALVISAAGAALDHDRPGPAGPPPLLDRLPLDKRGALVALQAEDHYVTVTTTTGRHMVLMRLADAIRETAPEPGLRVHRSHWVARAQVRQARRAGDGAVLVLTGGLEVPVSRSFLPAVTAAGLLPARGPAHG